MNRSKVRIGMKLSKAPRARRAIPLTVGLRNEAYIEVRRNDEGCSAPQSRLGGIGLLTASSILNAVLGVILYYFKKGIVDPGVETFTIFSCLNNKSFMKFWFNAN